jgi:hypothetical protein
MRTLSADEELGLFQLNTDNEWSSEAQTISPEVSV